MTVDLTNCDVEPIHLPGSIQPHGAMLVCDPSTGQVTHASENAATFIGRPAGTLVGLSLEQALGRHAAHELRNAAAKAGDSELAGVLLDIKLPEAPQAVDATIHRHNNLMFVELETSTALDGSTHDALNLTQSLIRRLGRDNDVDRLAKSSVRLLRAMLGYDRVMVYRFLHNGAGRVIAEARASNLVSFMGQHFPASDIPYQARRLYLSNSIRMISDVRFAPVPILPALGSNEAPIDMSFAQLRSVSPIHCQYLSNMGVSASMSISIIVDNELWGLIACHHDTPKVVPMPLRLGAELFGQYFSMQIAVAERRAERIAATQAREQLDQIVAQLEPGEPLYEAVSRHLADLSALIECDGAALWVNGNWTAIGRTPAEDKVEALTKALRVTVGKGVWSSVDLRKLDGSGTGYGDSVAGLLAIPISSSSRDFLLLFRSEEAFDIEWAGEPVKQVVSTPFGDRLTPRGSFELWREEVRGRAKPWTSDELTVAEAIRTYLRDVVLRFNEATTEERDRADQRRRMLNGELNHRVKNIISLIKSIALQTGAHAASVDDYSRSMEGRLRALAFAHDQSLDGSEGGDLQTLIEAEASLHRYDGATDRVTTNGPDIGLSDRTFGVLALVVHELMTNAAKYGSLSDPRGRLSISWSKTETGACALIWAESGGPTVSMPDRSGFGSKLIQSTIAYDLGGTASVEYAPEGVSARIVIPAEHLTETVGTIVRDPVSVIPGAALAGLDILLVEDQALVAMDTEETLRKLGATSVRSSPNVPDARTAMAAAAPDCAVLDFNLGQDTSAEIADHLVAGGIPFVFATGYGDNEQIPERFKDIPVVRKPVSAATLADKMGLARKMAQSGMVSRTLQ